jgi:ubiquinone/menaquinone biosynthesis C-methylase UbiE
MFFWIIKQIIISFLFIFTLHNIFTYFKNNLTVPKIKDLIRKPAEQYKEIYETEEKSLDKETMKNELKDYLKNLSKTDTSTKLESVGDVFSENSNNTFTTY